ncbi:Resolvase, N terminal domain [Thermosyntropha lipolytica DSM 11003]|uniref:Resolvase, N terminal domain n=1 Tax=Thermosyntropha lipolytica DSM 11003 TaxID=1123382 RepID=A0A1M5S055_9FIRM|nr:Resolvase, N terminal domain [Thermosyntropha lipolytica DSM 11003]
MIVHKLDRFARNRYDSAFYRRELKKNGVQIVSVTENLDDSPESIILESVLEGMAEYYSRNLAREVMKGMKETAYKCKHTGGRPPLRYDAPTQTQGDVLSYIYTVPLYFLIQFFL